MKEAALWLVTCAVALILTSLAVMVGSAKSAQVPPVSIEVPRGTNDMIYQRGGSSVRITDHPCTDEKMLKALTSQKIVTRAKRAHVIREGFDSQDACWGVDEDNDVIIITVLGQGGYLPYTAFRPTGI